MTMLSHIIKIQVCSESFKLFLNEVLYNQTTPYKTKMHYAKLLLDFTILEGSRYEEVRSSDELNEFTIKMRITDTKNGLVEGSGSNHDGSGYGSIEDAELNNDSGHLQNLSHEEAMNDDEFINDDEGTHQ